MAQSPGLDSPQAIGPYLNGKFPALEPTGASEWIVEETFLGININLPMHLTPYPGTNKLLCIAKEGRVYLFENTPAVTQTEIFLDLRSSVFNNSDSGMTYLVFHPEFGQPDSPNRGYVYITYKARTSDSNGPDAYWRLSRFTVPDGTQAADPASEQILIQQYDRQQFHDAGCMEFGADGYLYISVGDEGGANDEFNVAQKINHRLFSGIMRIDVDGKPGSHDIRRQPTRIPMLRGHKLDESYTANYKIPADNPFVNTNGEHLEEFYAIGLRQPYRFSHDTVTNLTWIAESGQDTREEIDILAPGANYGWPFREGKIARPTGPQPPVIPSPIIGTLTEPVWDVAHGVDNCIIGGYVYRGTTYPSLVGKYITVDNVTSHIRAHVLDNGVATNEILADMPSGSVYSGTSTIGRDTAGDPVFIKINGTGSRGQFFKLATIPLSMTRSAWYRFEDQDESNLSGYVADNPESSVSNSIFGGVPMLTVANGTNNSSNVTYSNGSGMNPTGFPANNRGVHIAAGNGTGFPGNAPGELFTESRLGGLNDFTVELSFHPNAGSLNGGYQTFLGLHGTTGVVPSDGEAGQPIQPFRLMRWARNDNNATSIPLRNGDLYVNVRTINPVNGAWTSVPVRILPANQFVTDRWYHLAIVGSVSEGTIKAYSYNPTTGVYDLLGTGAGYVGNLQPGVWTVGRGTYSGAAADYVTDAFFDEIRITDSALPVSRLLYGTDPWTPVIPPIEPPPLLSQTGAFSDLASLTPSAGVVPYNVNAPLWSDAAAKLRWIALPNDGVHDQGSEKIRFKPEGTWAFPTGTVFIKHFELATDENHPSVHRKLETRFIIVPVQGEPYGVTYRWREDGSDAELLEAGLNEPIEITEVGGGTREQIWTYPSRNECKVCHNVNADYILGVNTHQLNGDLTYPLTGRTANQLKTLGSLGWFDANYREDLVEWMLKSHHVEESTASLTDRVRSYLDSNCSQCHQPGGVRAYFDARYTTPLDDQGLVYGALETSYGHPDNRLIVPGNPERSIMLTRLDSVAEIKMPPIAKHVVDEAAVTLLTNWIDSLGRGPSVDLTTPSGVDASFPVQVRFSQDVTGLQASDFVIANGRITSFSGSGSEYVLEVSPANYGVVRIKLPAGSAVNAAGLENHGSRTLTLNYQDQDLVAWLKFDEESGTVALDSSGSETHGTLVGLTDADRSVGKFDGALSFGTGDERVTIPNVVGRDFSISFWMRTNVNFPQTDAPAQGAAIFFADVPGYGQDFMIAGTRSGGGLNRIGFQTGAPNTVASGSVSVSTGEWVHVVVTRQQSDGRMEIFVNGVPDGVAYGSTVVLDQNPVISIGATPGIAGSSYQGDLDEVRIFTRVLNSGEVMGLLNETRVQPHYDRWVESWLPGIYHLHDSKLDKDGDGMTNFSEFAFGGSPIHPDVIQVPLERDENGRVFVSYRARKPDMGVGYTVKVSTDCVYWEDVDSNITEIFVRDIPDTDYEWVDVTYTPPAEAEDKLFFRVEATEQP